MKSTSNPRTSYFWLLLLGVFGAGCADSDELGIWELEEPGERMAPIVRGVYAVEHEILDDGCEPSLSEIFGKVEQFPPPNIFVHLDVGATADGLEFGEASIPAFLWRTGYFTSKLVLLDQNMIPFSTRLWEDEWTSLNYSISYGECSVGDIGNRDYRTRVEVLYRAENIFEVIVHSDWENIEQCTRDSLNKLYKTLPEVSCSESYKSTYRLIEECPAPCENRSTSIEGGIIDGYAYDRYDLPPGCVCP